MDSCSFHPRIPLRVCDNHPLKPSHTVSVGWSMGLFFSHFFSWLDYFGRYYNPGHKYMVLYTLKICYVFIIAPCSMMKAALFPKLGPPSPPPPPPIQCCFKGDTLSTLTQHCMGGGGEEWCNCQKRPSVP